jgi:uncharacterized protein
MNCRPNCAACCIELSISSPIPGLPDGKAAGVPCLHLTDDLRCGIYGKPGRPAVCAGLKPLEEMCGANAAEARTYLRELEKITDPSRSTK